MELIKKLVLWTLIFFVVTYAILYVRVYEEAEHIHLKLRIRIALGDLVNFFFSPFQTVNFDDIVKAKKQINYLLEVSNNMLKDNYSSKLNRVVDFVIPFDLSSSPSLLLLLSDHLSSPPSSSSSIPLISHGEGIRVRYYQPKEEREEKGGVVYLHGGGWTVGTVESYDMVCRAMAVITGYAVFSIDYRTAPEHPFPYPPDDVYFASRWLVHHAATSFHLNPSHLAVSGDSAGGNLATVVSLMGINNGEGRLFEYAYLIYPGVSLMEFNTESYVKYGVKDYVIGMEGVRWFTSQYLNTTTPEKSSSLKDWKAAPIHAPTSLLRYLPPTTVAVASFDPLYSEGLEYAALLQSQAVPADVISFPSVHGFITEVDDTSVSLLSHLASSLHSHFSPSSSI